MLHSDSHQKEQDDLKSLGKIVQECLDHALFSQKEEQHKTRSWESNVVNFVKSTHDKSAKWLLQVSDMNLL